MSNTGNGGAEENARTPHGLERKQQIALALAFVTAGLVALAVSPYINLSPTVGIPMEWPLVCGDLSGPACSAMISEIMIESAIGGVVGVSGLLLWERNRHD